GGAGIPAFYTRSGVGTQVAEGGLPMRYDADGAVVKSSQAKPTDTFVLGEGYLSQVPDEPETYVLERSIVTDFSLVHAWKGDRHG
ncbi:succinyl-CoA--3-ketoacid-CoA transferase, partial [Xanthomonas citri pv. citri]|nr:succinyl-CoA--3-ketoacid-CoA transferase [Xanthomonas citri pv. citri]